MTITDNPDKTLTVTLTTLERGTLDRASVDHGSNVVRDLLAGWLRDRTAVQDERDARQTLAATRGLTDAEKASIPSDIRAKLGLT
jgi:hypothetical protein